MPRGGVQVLGMRGELPSWQQHVASMWHGGPSGHKELEHSLTILIEFLMMEHCQDEEFGL